MGGTTLNNKLYKMMNWPEIEEIIYSDGDNPHRILGAHKVGNSCLIQAFYPDALSMKVYIENSKKNNMDDINTKGFLEGLQINIYLLLAQK